MAFTYSCFISYVQSGIPESAFEFPRRRVHPYADEPSPARRLAETVTKTIEEMESERLRSRAGFGG